MDYEAINEAIERHIQEEVESAYDRGFLDGKSTTAPYAFPEMESDIVALLQQTLQTGIMLGKAMAHKESSDIDYNWTRYEYGGV